MVTLSSGGAERVLSNLSKPLADVFDSVTFVMWVDAPVFYKMDERVNIVSIQQEIGRSSELKRMLWFRHYVQTEKPDCILSFLEPINLRVLLATIGINVKKIVAERNDPHGVNKYWLMDQIEKLIYHQADKILVQTETIRTFFGGSLAKRTHIIYNPVNIPKEMVGKALLTPKKKRIVSVARLTQQKRHDVLIRAFAKFCKTHSDYCLTIYGEGPQRNELQKLVASLNVSDKVFLPGAIKTVHQEILDAEMFCLVSTREGMSNSMIEAMCLGLPCICTKVSGALDLIKHGENGLLIDIDNEESLCQQMCLVSDDKAYANRLGNQATQTYKILNSELISKQWVDFIEKQIKE